MQLTDLTAYAEEKYHIAEQRRWADFPGLSVLTDPGTGKWAALLMRQWDTDTGTEIQLCDIRCGRQALSEFSAPCLSSPYRMSGPQWVGVRVDEGTDPALVYRLFDRALASDEQRGFTLVLHSKPTPEKPAYKETALPFAKKPTPASESGQIHVETVIRKAVEIVKTTARRVAAETLTPEKLRQMRRLYVYGGSRREECRGFYKQAVFMADYEDDHPWQGTFQKYFPTYQDLRLEQLRGYFTWRAALRRGEFRPVPTSLAYIYVYELLNGIGTASVEERLQKIREFEVGYLDSGIGEQSMRRNLRRWMPELAVVKGLPPETVRQYFDADVLKQDEALAVLRKPKDRTDEEVFDALCLLSSGKIAGSPAAQEGRWLFAEAWRRAAAGYRENGKSLFALCFGEKRSRRWHPLENAVYYDPDPPKEMSCELSECRKYTLRSGVWSEYCYLKTQADKKRLDAFLHETDRRVRLWLKTGRPLQERPEEAWAGPFADAAIEEDRQRKAEAARQKVTIRFEDLDRIRRDAAVTRESLLTEEEVGETPQPETEIPPPPPASETAGGDAALISLSGEQRELLSLLLRGESAKDWIAARHAMATVLADGINETLYEALGDSAVECDGRDVTLVEDYREEILQLLGGDIT